MIKATLAFNTVRLKPSEIHKLRGFVGNTFPEYDIIHNHDVTTGKPIYRYPLIQFKLLHNTPVIIAISRQAVEAFAVMFTGIDHIVISGTSIPIYEKDINIEDVEYGFTNETFIYEFVSPWIGLNQENYKKYMTVDKAEKKQILKKTLIGNILSMSKALEYWLEKDQIVNADIQAREIDVNLKGKTMIGFTGLFKCNFEIPDDLGIGKSVSRGFGVVRKVWGSY